MVGKADHKRRGSDEGDGGREKPPVGDRGENGEAAPKGEKIGRDISDLFSSEGEGDEATKHEENARHTNREHHASARAVRHQLPPHPKRCGTEEPR